MTRSVESRTPGGAPEDDQRKALYVADTTDINPEDLAPAAPRSMVKRLAHLFWRMLVTIRRDTRGEPGRRRTHRPSWVYDAAVPGEHCQPHHRTGRRAHSGLHPTCARADPASALTGLHDGRALVGRAHSEPPPQTRPTQHSDGAACTGNHLHLIRYPG